MTTLAMHASLVQFILADDGDEVYRRLMGHEALLQEAVHWDRADLPQLDDEDRVPFLRPLVATAWLGAPAAFLATMRAHDDQDIPFGGVNDNAHNPIGILLCRHGLVETLGAWLQRYPSAIYDNDGDNDGESLMCHALCLEEPAPMVHLLLEHGLRHDVDWVVSSDQRDDFAFYQHAHTALRLREKLDASIPHAQEAPAASVVRVRL